MSDRANGPKRSLRYEKLILEASKAASAVATQAETTLYRRFSLRLTVVVVVISLLGAALMTYVVRDRAQAAATAAVATYQKKLDTVSARFEASTKLARLAAADMSSWEGCQEAVRLIKELRSLHDPFIDDAVRTKALAMAQNRDLPPQQMSLDLDEGVRDIAITDHQAATVMALRLGYVYVGDLLTPDQETRARDGFFSYLTAPVTSVMPSSELQVLSWLAEFKRDGFQKSPALAETVRQVREHPVSTEATMAQRLRDYQTGAQSTRFRGVAKEFLRVYGGVEASAGGVRGEEEVERGEEGALGRGWQPDDSIDPRISVSARTFFASPDCARRVQPADP